MQHLTVSNFSILKNTPSNMTIPLIPFYKKKMRLLPHSLVGLHCPQYYPFWKYLLAVNIWWALREIWNDKYIFFLKSQLLIFQFMCFPLKDFLLSFRKDGTAGGALDWNLDPLHSPPKKGLQRKICLVWKHFFEDKRSQSKKFKGTIIKSSHF